MDTKEAGKMGGLKRSERKAESSRINGLSGGRPISIINMNDDGYSIKSCKHIYAPSGKALEYSDLATNPYNGCGNQCVYCYVPNILRMKRPDFDSSAIERSFYLDHLTRDAKKYSYIKSDKQIMFSFTTDPYHPFDTSLTRKAMQVLINNELGFCALTKGGSRAIRDIDLYRPDIDCFASTLTSFDDSFSRKYERGAAVASERIDTLKRFSENGIFTWVSIEPTLSVIEAKKIIRETNGFVNHYKIGKANYIKLREEIDWEAYTTDIINLCIQLGVSFYIKKDLQAYVPDHIENNMRITQHF